MNTARNQQSKPAVVSEPTRVEFIRNLASVQNHLKVGKGHQNEFGNYSYRNAADILQELKPILSEFGYFLRISSEIVEVTGRHYVKTTVTITDGVNEESASAMARETLERKKYDDSQLTGAATTYSKKYALENLFCIDENKDADSWDNRQNNQPRQQPRQNNRSQGYNQVAQQHHQPNQNHQQPHQHQQNAGYGFQQPTGQDPRQANPQTRTGSPVITPAQVQNLRQAMRMAGCKEAQFCRAAKIEQIGQLTQDRLKNSLNWLQRKAM